MRRAALAACVLLAGAACGAGERAPAGSAPAAAGRTRPVRFFDARTFARALARAERTPPRPVPGARAVIVPHHWLAGHLIVGGLRDLAASGPWERVILIGPNHIGAGGASVTTTGRAWPTPFGTVEPDAAAVRALIGSGLAHAAPDALTYEHSVAGLVPAVAALLPGARLVALVLRNDLRVADVRTLARALAALAGERTAIVASVDFSHDLTPAEARARDRETIAAMRALDTARILGFGNEHLDAPASIAVLIETARTQGATRFVVRENTSSGELTGRGGRGTTSYVVGFYRP